MSRSLTWSQRVRFQFAAITRMALRINRGMVTSKTLWAVVISKLKSWKMWNIFQRFDCSFSNFFLFGPPISLPRSKLNERKVLLSSPVFVSLSCTSNAGCCACLILFSFLYIRKDWGVWSHDITLSFFGWTGYQSLRRYIGFNNLTCDLRSNNHYLSGSENKVWKNSGLHGICIRDHCDTGAVLYQLS